MAEENDNDELIPQPTPFPPEMIEEAENETVAHQVREYLLGKGPIGYSIVSANMPREIVSRFVEFEMRDLPPNFFWRVRILADLYNLTEHLDKIQSFLNRQESKPIDLDRSIAGAITLWEIGDAAQKKFAVEYYEYLVSHPLANQKFAELLRCLEVFGNRVSPKPLRSRMEQEIAVLSARENGDPEAGVEKRAVEELVLNEFFFIEETNQSRERISAIADADQRLVELIRVYLQLTDDAGAEYFNLWTQQQIRRTAETEGTEKVIEAFRRTVEKSDEVKADEVYTRVRAGNAVEFFSGKLTGAEEELMKANRQKQFDPLHYMAIPLHIEDAEEIEPEEEEDEKEDEDEQQTV